MNQNTSTISRYSLKGHYYLRKSSLLFCVMSMYEILASWGLYYSEISIGASLKHIHVMNVDTVGLYQFSSVQLLSCVWLCNPMDCSKPCFPVHHQPSKLPQTHIHQIGDASNHPILCCPFLFLPSIFPNIRVFSTFSYQVAKVLQLQLQHQSFQSSGLISFRIDWFDLLTVQGEESSPTP